MTAAEIIAMLPGDLPTDWQLYETVAPGGAEAGLSPRHGYNYLMEMVNRAHMAIKFLAGGIGGFQLITEDVPASERQQGTLYALVRHDWGDA